MDTEFIVLFDGARIEVRKFGISDLVAFEKHFGVSASVFQADEEGKQEARMEWICFLIWRGLRKLGVIDKETAFDDDFLDRIEDIDAGANEETSEPVPTQAPA